MQLTFYSIGEENEKVSEYDEKILKLLRANIATFLATCANQYDREGLNILDIAPQVHEGAKFYFKRGNIKTLDIDANSGCDYIAD